MKKLIIAMFIVVLAVSCNGKKETDTAKTDDVTIVKAQEGEKNSKELLADKTEKELASASITPVERKDVGDAQIENGIVKKLPENNLPTLLDFTATWCGPCKMMKPVFEELEETYEERMNFVSIDIDINSGLAEQFGIRAVPTFVFLTPEGKIVKTVEGAVRQTILENQINIMIAQ